MFRLNEMCDDDGDFTAPLKPGWLNEVFERLREERKVPDTYANCDDPDQAALDMMQRAELGTAADYDAVVGDIADMIRFAKAQAAAMESFRRDSEPKAQRDEW